MKNKIIETRTKTNYHVIIDKVMCEKKEMYLCENYKTKKVELIDPIDILNIVDKKRYFVTEYEICPNNIEYFRQCLKEIYDNSENGDTVMVTRKLLNEISEIYGFNFQISEIHVDYWCTVKKLFDDLVSRIQRFLKTIE
jgi:hypothetical protein